jgi:hypothetical protein
MFSFSCRKKSGNHSLVGQSDANDEDQENLQLSHILTIIINTVDKKNAQNFLLDAAVWKW